MSRTPTPPPLAHRPASATTNLKPTAEDELLFHDYAELSQKVVKKPLILFFGRPTFSDNTKYLFLATAQASAGCDVVWCSFSKPLLAQLEANGIRCFDMSADLRRTVNLFLEAAVVVFCENLAAALGWSTVLAGALAGAQRFQLWHGVSVKHLSLMLMPHLDLFDAQFRRQLRFASKIEYLLSTSSQLDAFWIRAFGCTNLVRAGQPRNEVIVRPPTKEEMIGAELPANQAELLHSNKKKFLVVPTWQRGKVQIHISTPAFYTQLAKWAAANDAVVFVKSHPFLLNSGVPENIGGRIFFLGAGVDVYPWMSKFDALITDYSSIMFDFLLTHKPIFTFNSRTQVSYGFEPDYSLIPEGNFRYEFNADNFEATVARNLGDHPRHAEQRLLSAQLFETPAQDACATLVPFLTDLCTKVVDKNFTVMTPTKYTPHLRVAV
jgi:CDP-glycerol glycerophosphotransferase